MFRKIPFTEKEIKTRKTWLITLNILFCIFILSASLLFYKELRDTYALKDPSSSETSIWIGGVFAILFLLLIYLGYYRFSYKKMGTKFLTFFLILNYLSFFKLSVIIIFLITRIIYEPSNQLLNILMFSFCSILTAPFIWIIYIWTKMRKINHKYKPLIRSMKLKTIK